MMSRGHYPYRTAPNIAANTRLAEILQVWRVPLHTSDKYVIVPFIGSRVPGDLLPSRYG